VDRTLAATTLTAGLLLAAAGALALWLPAPVVLLVVGLVVAGLGLFGVDVDRRTR
jgi:hypothetical protein